jgi:hypothetical protein
MTTLFVADPNIPYLDTIDELPLARFMALPDHPAQRQTTLHATTLMASGVLNQPLDQHREVQVILIGQSENGVPIDALLGSYQHDREDAIARYGHKLNGHTRAFCWGFGNGTPVPDTVRATVYAASDLAAATKAYNAVDSGTSVKGRKDMAQTTVKVAGITPKSPWLRKASSVPRVLRLAAAVICGSRDFVLTELRTVLLDKLQPIPFIYQELHRALPDLAAMMYFKAALEAFDALTPTAAIMPMRDCFAAGYISILHRDPEGGKEFLEKLQVESGSYQDGAMDAFYAIKKVADKIFNKREMQKTTAAQRDMMILATVLNAYEGWVGSRDFKADKFPVDQQIVATFNPILREAIDTVRKTNARTKIQEKQRQAAERRSRKANARRRPSVPPATEPTPELPLAD